MEILLFPSETRLSEPVSALCRKGCTRGLHHTDGNSIKSPLNHTDVVCAGHFYHTPGHANRGKLWPGTSSIHPHLSCHTVSASKCLTTENKFSASFIIKHAGGVRECFGSGMVYCHIQDTRPRLDCWANSIWGDNAAVVTEERSS